MNNSLSLYKNNTDYGAAFGKEAITANTVEFAQYMNIRATDSEGISTIKDANDVIGITIKNITRSEYDALTTKDSTILYAIDEFDYDLIDPNTYSEIDIIYTADMHGYQKGYESGSGTTRWSLVTSYNANSIEALCTNLLASNIKPILVDGGDFARGSSKAYADQGAEMMSNMKSLGYSVCVLGNNELDNFNSTTAYDHLSFIRSDTDFVNNCLTACNLFDSSTNELVFKPYRAFKIGGIKLGIIGCSFPGSDYWLAQDNRWANYSFLDDEELYREVQKYIDLFKENNFDFIGVVGHLGAEGNESRTNVYMYDIVSHTSGLDFATLAHTHQLSNQTTITDKDGKSVVILAQPYYHNNYVCRAKLTGSRSTGISITSTNITSAVV